MAEIKEQVEQALGDIRPALQADGGDIELVDVTDDGVVQVRLMGHCAGCPMSQMTLTHGVERHLNVAAVKSRGFGSRNGALSPLPSPNTPWQSTQ